MRDNLFRPTVPRDDDDPRDTSGRSKVDHKCRAVDAEVIEYKAAADVTVCDAIYRLERLASFPFVAHVTLVMSLAVDPRLLLEGKVLHWGKNTKKTPSKPPYWGMLKKYRE